MFAQGMSANLSEEEIAAYRAFFPSAEYEAGILRFPLLIAVQPDNPGGPLNRAAWEKLKKFDKPFLTIFGAFDPVSKGSDKRAHAEIPGAKGQDHATIGQANHFIQEDAPEILVEKIKAFIERTSS